MFHLSTLSVKWRIPRLTSKFDLLILHKKYYYKISHFFAIWLKQYADIELSKSNFYDSIFYSCTRDFQRQKTKLSGPNRN